MILPSTTLASLLLLILALFCWGSWANTEKLTSGWRFELYYCDFMFGMAICVLIAIFTLGSMNQQELTMTDNLLIASYRKMAYAIAAGMVINLANMLLAGTISLAGIAATFPITFSVALIVNSIVSYAGNPRSANAGLLFGGMVLILAALLANILSLMGASTTEASKVPKPAPAPARPAGRNVPPAPRPKNPIRAIPIGIASGLAFGFFFPIIDYSRLGDNGVSPYGVALLVGCGMFFSTVLYLPFFVNFPVQGEPVRMGHYFLAMRRYHFWGILGGFAWTAGLIAILVEQAAPTPLQAGTVVSSMLIWGAPILAAIWGAGIWRELKDAPRASKTFFLGMVVLFISGLTFMSMAQIYGGR